MLISDDTLSTVFDLIYRDPHQWSKRPCPTCRAVAALTKKQFGCLKLNGETVIP